MKISIADIHILLSCAHYILRVSNQDSGYTSETIKAVYDKMIECMDDISLEVEKK